MNKPVASFFSALVILWTASTFGQTRSTGTTAILAGSSQFFDPARGVVLRSEAGQELAELCGASPNSKGWPVASSDIVNLEQILAPLLAADLAGAGSQAQPSQYYRQYASGRLGQYHVIFVNGFYEGYFSHEEGNSSWRHRAVVVFDGGAHDWCAIYVKDHNNFIRFKGDSLGGKYVSFHGIA
jgi:hypothetical protein